MIFGIHLKETFKEELLECRLTDALVSFALLELTAFFVLLVSLESLVSLVSLVPHKYLTK